MPLVIIADEISVNPYDVQYLVATARSPTGPYQITICGHQQVIATVTVDTPDAAKAFIADSTAKINGELLSPMGDTAETRVPAPEDLDAKSGQLLDDILDELRETSCAIREDLDGMTPSVYSDMMNRLYVMIRKHHGGKA